MRGVDPTPQHVSFAFGAYKISLIIESIDSRESLHAAPYNLSNWYVYPSMDGWHIVLANVRTSAARSGSHDPASGKELKARPSDKEIKARCFPAAASISSLGMRCFIVTVKVIATANLTGQ